MGDQMGIAKVISIKVLSFAGLMMILLGLATAAHANIRVKPSSINFGSQAVGSTSAAQTVTVTNDDNWGSITISGVAASAAQFSFSGPSLPVKLEPGQSLTGTVTFHPSAAQTYSGGLQFERGNRFTISIALSGTGTSSGSSSGGTPPVAPAISSQPASVKIATGQTATFNVAATGTSPLQFQWNKNGAAISGATSSTYTTPPAAMSDNNDQFTAQVSNTAGNATSNAAVLTVTGTTAVAPSISTQPANQSVIAGNTATFSVAATGTAPLTYQWSKNGTSISGATSSSYTTPAETTTDNNAQFTVAVSNSAGSATSSAATLTVSAATLILNSSASSVGFGSVNLSSTGTQTVTLTNAGNSNVTVNNVTVSGAGFNASGVSSGQILTPGQKVTLTATFTPSSAGSATGSVSVASNASNSPDSIALTGTGAATSGSVMLSWTASTSTVAGYNAYVAQTSGGPYTKMNSSPVTETSYTDSNVAAGTYYFVVTSVNSSNVESSDSAQVSAVVP
jgi:hypothetical protein